MFGGQFDKRLKVSFLVAHYWRVGLQYDAMLLTVGDNLLLLTPWM